MRARSLAGGCGVDSLLVRGGAGGGEMTLEAEAVPAPLENLMAELHQESKKKANKIPIKIIKWKERKGIKQDKERRAHPAASGICFCCSRRYFFTIASSCPVVLFRTRSGGTVAAAGGAAAKGVTRSGPRIVTSSSSGCSVEEDSPCSSPA